MKLSGIILLAIITTLNSWGHPPRKPRGVGASPSAVASANSALKTAADSVCSKYGSGSSNCITVQTEAKNAKSNMTQRSPGYYQEVINYTNLVNEQML